jgi:hypothetical protein|tara:strand:- start:10944 stop:11222 length:279 start_codon:yes stop_codon:yes gene_type:complete
MKMTKAHYIELKQAIDTVLTSHNSKGELVRAYEAGEFNRSNVTKDLQRRFCFDVLWGTGLSSWVCKELYEYLNDDHLYTALKSLCPIVSKQY